MKAYLIFLDDEKECAYFHELSIDNICIDTPNISFPSVVQRIEEYTYKIKIKVPSINEKGKPTIKLSWIERKREILEYSPYGIIYGDFTETKLEYLKREKEMIMRLLKR